MNAYPGPVYPAPPPRSGLGPAAAVLLWVFIGWPLSWLLLFVFVPLGILFGIGITILMIVVVSTGGSRPHPVVVNVGPPPPALPSPRQQAVRHEVESIAVVTPIGGCGWCGSLVAHMNGSGHPVPPRYWHAAEIEERIRGKLQA